VFVVEAECYDWWVIGESPRWDLELVRPIGTD